MFKHETRYWPLIGQAVPVQASDWPHDRVHFGSLEFIEILSRDKNTAQSNSPSPEIQFSQDLKMIRAYRLITLYGDCYSLFDSYFSFSLCCSRMSRRILL